GIAKLRAAVFISQPFVIELPTRRNFRSRSCGNVVGAFIVLGVTEAVWMHTVAASGNERTVAKMNDHLVANFGTDNRPQYTKPLWLLLWRSKAGIGVLDVANFGKNVAVGPGIGNFSTVDEVLIAGSEIPNHVLRLNVVMTNLVIC